MDLNAVLTEMLVIQDDLAKVMIGSSWRTSRAPDFRLAIRQECAEAIDHLGWKWWKNFKPNIAAAQVEVVDMLHFVLMDALHHYGLLSYREVADELLVSYECRYGDVVLDEKGYEPSQMTTIGLFSLISALEAVDRTDFGLIMYAGERVDLSFLDTARLYRAKATLNLFRQKNGDREGTYNRMWGPKLEDNDFMQQLMPQIDWTSGDAARDLYNRLERTYLQVALRG